MCNKMFHGDMLHSCLLTPDREPKTDTVFFPAESVALNFTQAAVWFLLLSGGAGLLRVSSLACLRVFFARFIADSGRKGPSDYVSFKDFLKNFVLLTFSFEEHPHRIEYVDHIGKSFTTMD